VRPSEPHRVGHRSVAGAAVASSSATDHRSPNVTPAATRRADRDVLVFSGLNAQQPRIDPLLSEVDLGMFGASGVRSVGHQAVNPEKVSTRRSGPRHLPPGGTSSQGPLGSPPPERRDSSLTLSVRPERTRTSPGYAGVVRR